MRFGLDFGTSNTSLAVWDGSSAHVLPIDRTSRLLAPQLELAGYDVTYEEFEGGHVLTPETMRAIRTFEADQALPETGRVSGPLVSRLARVSGDRKIAAGL